MIARSMRGRWALCAVLCACAAPPHHPHRPHRPGAPGAGRAAQAPSTPGKPDAATPASPEPSPAGSSGEATGSTATSWTPSRVLELTAIAPLVQRSLARAELPGCVIAIGSSAGLDYLQAFGKRSLDPAEAMTVGTVFDMASVTKPLATAASLMLLEAEGRLDPEARVADYLPGFAGAGKGNVRVHQLLTHTSGLPRVNALREYDGGPSAAFARIFGTPLKHPAGQVFQYSDVGYIVLGHLLEVIAGEPLADFAQRRVFEPLGMRDTRFRPPLSQAARTAPTEVRDDQPIRGVVDDPRAYRLGGAAGNAGVFSTAHDMVRFARTLLGGGELEGTRLWPEKTVSRWTQLRPAGSAQRTWGWDARSGYAKGRGRTMGTRTFGHSGYTGTSLWIDPDRDLFVVLLSNRVHVGPRGTIYPLASSIADIAAQAVDRHAAASPTGSAPPNVPNVPNAPNEPTVRSGLDVLRAEAFARVRGESVVLLTNGAARAGDGSRAVELLRDTRELKLRALWTPEHGLSAKREGHVAGGSFGALPVHSLFGKNRDPKTSMLHGATTIVVDLQDVGARFYTYAATVHRVLRFAAAQGLSVVILDRPNPLGGERVRGPITEPEFESFVNHHPLPIVHGMTLGELAGLVNTERQIGADVRVLPMQGWTRSMGFAATGLKWRAPSPNLRRLEQVVLYPGVALVEGTNVSVGRGTDSPFELVGAPFLDADALVAELRAQQLPGVEFEAAHFRPNAARHRGALCHGARLKLTDTSAYAPVRTGLALARALAKLAPDAWDRTRLGPMIGHRATLDAVDSGMPFEQIRAGWQVDLDAFLRRRSGQLLYPAGPAASSKTE